MFRIRALSLISLDCLEGVFVELLIADCTLNSELPVHLFFQTYLFEILHVVLSPVLFQFREENAVQANQVTVETFLML